MKQSTRLGLHLSYWLLYGFLVSFLLMIAQATDQPALPEADDWIAILLFTFLTGAASFYTFYGGLAPRYLPTRRTRLFLGLGTLVCLGIALVSTLLVSLSTTLLLYLSLDTVQWILFSMADQLVLLVGFALLALVNAVTGTLLRGSLTWYTEIHLRERMANRQLQTELAWIKAQLNPHFLFNTLHNIDVLIEHDAPRASLYLNKLSDLLRFSLYETQAEQIPLAQELACIEKYVELQRIRTAHAHYVTLQLEGEADGLWIAPMLFMPYLENAFKYATRKNVAEAIRIQIAVEDHGVRFQCVNLLDSSRPTTQQQGGLGQDLLRQRLALLYPQQHTLLIEATNTTYSVNLTLSLQAHALSAG
ncbi:sensor histidine kinase [Larkinella soli]|uniref:sensor histidine kinase n=1 Tax=Larkinella soli TaxID=1770527 RepID=UPI000FFB24F7|nr:sensor histidine kinase [Larkinella soli]